MADRVASGLLLASFSSWPRAAERISAISFDLYEVMGSSFLASKIGFVLHFRPLIMVGYQ